MFIDTHAHLEDKGNKLNDLLQRAKDAGVEKIISIGFNYQSSIEAVEIAKKYPEVYAVVGIHPHDAKSYNNDAMEGLYKLAKDKNVVAIGEMGLDFYRDLSPRETQRKVFREQIKIAQELYMPVVIHDRDAHQEVLDIIKQEKAGKNEGIMHCYSGNLPLAIELMKQGLYISLAGPVTFKNAKKSHEVAVKVTQDRLLIETDSPYLAPEPFRGKKNEPAYIKYTAEKIAKLRGKTTEEIGYITSLNAKKVYRIND
ncbi:putative metal-dependent hydrolase YcfH [Candidatus Syntrophocurvum alkaliphilum]|uniref:Putative metal-dependent hydrolase YcfH n=2 Tax=Candidatus Syntrophocurvum alkaliphilum TaxID=2293317 RepID=A0A6I6DD89_9FIRM|nr:putative metal-dependent hydrolase YcfH [Candidatus Syntrophocurvum alkaliphilum]